MYIKFKTKEFATEFIDTVKKYFKNLHNLLLELDKL